VIALFFRAFDVVGGGRPEHWPDGERLPDM